MATTPPIDDLDALAAQHGATDLDSLAGQFGGTAAPEPQTAADKFVHFMKFGPKLADDSTLLQGALDFLKGAGGSAAENFATVGGWVAPQSRFTNVMRQVAQESPENLAGMGGKLSETIAEWMIGEGELKALTQSARFAKLAEATKILERYPSLATMLGSHPEVIGQIPGAARTAALSAVQTALHGGSATDVAESALTGGALHHAGAIIGGPSKWLGALASGVAPEVADIGGVKFTRLASEAVGPEGQPIASKAAQEAAQYASEPKIQAERQAAFKQLNQNLAQQGVANALEDSNRAMTDAGLQPSATPGFNPQTDIRQSASGAWRYYPPSGAQSLTETEAKSLLSELKQRWLDSDLGPREEARLRQAYNDIDRQLKTNQEYRVNTPIGTPHDVTAAASGINSFGDAATHLADTAEQKLQLMGRETRAQYQNLVAERDAAQAEFDRARYNPDDQAAAQTRVDSLNKQIAELFKGSEATGSNAPEMMAQGLKEHQLASAFRELQNAMDRHFNMSGEMAADTNRPQIAKNLSSLADDISRIKADYGSVLDPVLGENGLNHLVELGDQLKPTGPSLRASPKDYLGNLAMVMRRHFTGMRGIIAGGGGLAVAHMIGHGIAGAAGGLGVLGTEAAYRMVRNRLATDPVLAQRMLFAMKHAIPPRIAAPLLATMMMGLRSAQQAPPEDQNAPTQ